MFRTIFVLLLVAAQFAPSTATAQAKPVYLAVGDSLTVGLYATDGRGFAYMVADALPGYALEVAAETGDGIDNTLKQLPVELADHAPALVTVEVGINNLGNMSASTFQVRYVQLLQTLQDAGVQYVVTCTVPWTGQGVGTPQYVTARKFNAAIVKATLDFGYVPADCWNATAGHYEYLSSIDGFHPNDAGHRVIAGVLLYNILRPVHWLPDIRR